MIDPKPTNLTRATALLEQTFKNIDDILHKDAGCSSELDYVEQSSWILFLKYLADLDKDRQLAAKLKGDKYKSLIGKRHRWDVWAASKKADGSIDHHKAFTGDDLSDFVNLELWPYLSKFKDSADGSATIECKIGEIFGELKNRVQSDYNLREVMNLVEAFAYPTTKQAEVFTTTFAAWNNLILQGKECSDEAIVTEAREDWHQKKLNIDRSKFFDSIQWIRTQKVTPKGYGRVVVPKIGKQS